MKNLSKKIDVYGLTTDEIQQLRQIAKERYGKASVSLLAKKLLQAQIRQTEIENTHEEQLFERLTLRLPPKQQVYLTQKAKEQHSTLNEVARDIIAEYITKKPVLGNDAVQALFQYNYQLLRIGRNINQIARKFNEMSPHSFTTKQLNEFVEYLDYHTDIVYKILEKQEKPLKFSESWRLMYAATKQTN